MGRRVTVYEAASATGLSPHELRTGAKRHKYPCIWIGEAKPKPLFDLEELEDAIHLKSMQNVIKVEAELANGKIQRVNP